MQLFARITKVDAVKRQVTGTLVQECLDRSGEIFDYATSKSHFVDWSDGISKATEGKSVGNLRVMHGNVVAGKFSTIDFNDAQKSIDVVADVIDDAEWKKVEAGCYTGFSIGGKYAKKWQDDADEGATRYTAIPAEGSLVDLPCIPSAQFKMVKADGSDEMRKFITPDAEADPPTIVVEPVGKGMGHVAQLAGILREVGYLTSDQFDEAAREGDGSAIPAQLQDWLKAGAGILTSMAAEEASELVADSAQPVPDDVAVITLAAANELGTEDEVGKVGAKHSAATIQHHECIASAAQTILDHCAALSGVDASKAAEPDELAKAAADEMIAKALVTTTVERDDALTKVAALTAELDVLKAKPVPVKAAVLSVSKSEDNTVADVSTDLRKQIEAMPDGEDKVKALIRLSHLAPS